MTGAQGALHIWTRFLRSLYSQSGPLAITPPEGIETAVIDLKTGYLATSSCPQTIREAYIKGTAPKKKCPDHPEKSSNSISNSKVI
jgi:membrane carboxypeptidase/penicillin-binding protein